VRFGGEYVILDVLTFEQTAPTATAVPTMNEWGMILFVVLAGCGSIYYMGRQRRANS